MKKTSFIRFTIFLPFVLFFHLSEAQITAGFQGGISYFTFLNYNDEDDTEKVLLKDGVYIALPIAYRIRKNTFLQIEPSFIRKGVVAHWSEGNLSNPSSYQFQHKEYRMDYIGSGLLLKRNIPIRNRGFGIATGFDTAYLLQGKITTYSGSLNGIDVIRTQDLDAILHRPMYSLRRWDFSWVFDLSLPTETGIGTFIAGGRYMLDLTPWRKYHDVRPENTGRMYNSGFIIYAGYLIPDGSSSRPKKQK